MCNNSAHQGLQLYDLVAMPFDITICQECNELFQITGYVTMALTYHDYLKEEGRTVAIFEPNEIVKCPHCGEQIGKFMTYCEDINMYLKVLGKYLSIRSFCLN